MPIIEWISVIIIFITTTIILVIDDWRWNIGVLAIQYLAIFLLTYSAIPLSNSGTKLIIGWMICVILGITKNYYDGPHLKIDERLFRGVLIFFIGISSIIVATRISTWLALDLPISWGGFLLITFGLLELGTSNQIEKVVVGLLIFLSGFQILYSSLENSNLVEILSGTICLGLAFTSAYLLTFRVGGENK